MRQLEKSKRRVKAKYSQISGGETEWAKDKGEPEKETEIEREREKEKG